MSDRSRTETSKEGRPSELDALAAASKAERPRDGAKGRALARVLPELRVAVAADAGRPQGIRLRTQIMGAVVLAAAVTTVAFVKHQQDVALAEQAQAQQMLAEQRAQADRLMAQLNQQTAAVQNLQAAVRNATDTAGRAAARAALDEVNRQTAKTAAAAAGSGGGRASTCNCTPGDPLCSCIP